MGLNFKKFLFLFSLLMVAIVNPAVCWTFFIIDHSSADAFSFNSYYDTWRFTYLLLVTFPVLILINIIVTMCGYKSTSRFNKDRWEQAIYGRGQLKVAGDDEEHLIEENSVGIAHLGGYVEPKPEYNPTVRKCTEKNLQLDHSVMSLYFISQMNLDAEDPFIVKNELTIKKEGRFHTLQE